MRATIPVLLVVMIAFAACKKCQVCEFQWKYTERDTTYRGIEISNEKCGLPWVLDDHNQEVTDEREELDVLLKKDPEKKDIDVTSVTCTETPY